MRPRGGLLPNVGVTPPVGKVSSFLSDVVSPTVPLAKGVDEVVMDSLAPLVAAKGGLLPNVAGVAPLAVAVVASSADFAGMAFLAVTGVASPVDLAGMAFPADVGVMSPTEFAGMSLSAIAGVAPPAELAGMAFPAVAGAASLAVVEVAFTTDSMEPAGSPSVWAHTHCGRLIPDYFVPDVVVFPENIELGTQL